MSSCSSRSVPALQVWQGSVTYWTAIMCSLLPFQNQNVTLHLRIKLGETAKLQPYINVAHRVVNIEVFRVFGNQGAFPFCLFVWTHWSLSLHTQVRIRKSELAKLINKGTLSSEQKNPWLFSRADQRMPSGAPPFKWDDAYTHKSCFQSFKCLSNVS